MAEDLETRFKFHLLGVYIKMVHKNLHISKDLFIKSFSTFLPEQNCCCRNCFLYAHILNSLQFILCFYDLEYLIIFAVFYNSVRIYWATEQVYSCEVPFSAAQQALRDIFVKLYYWNWFFIDLWHTFIISRKYKKYQSV